MTATRTHSLLIISAFFSLSAFAQDMTNYSVISPRNKPVDRISATIATSNGAETVEQTDAGILPLTPVNSEFMLSILGDNIVSTYFYETNWSPRRLVVNTVATEVTQKITGTTQGFKPKNLDGEVDFAFVISALKKSDILAFDLRKILSDETDTLSIYTKKIEIPANLTLPKQNEMYILPITLDKPNFSLSLPKEELPTLFTLRGQFNLQKLMAGNTGASSEYYLLLNYLNLMGGSLRSVPPEVINKPITLPVDQFSFTDKKSIPLPTWAADETLLVLALNKSYNFYLPSDIQFVGSGTSITMNFIPQTEQSVAYVLKRKSELDPKQPGVDRISVQLAPVGINVERTLIPLVENPMLTQQGTLRINLPSAPALIKSQRQLVQVTQVVKTLKNGKEVTDYKKILEMWYPEWKSEVTFPQPLAELCGQCRIDVSLMGSTEENQSNDELEWIEKATHVSHVSIGL